MPAIRDETPVQDRRDLLNRRVDAVESDNAFGFMKAHPPDHPIATMCRLLEVSASAELLPLSGVRRASMELPHDPEAQRANGGEAPGSSAP